MFFGTRTTKNVWEVGGCERERRKGGRGQREGRKQRCLQAPFLGLRRKLLGNALHSSDFWRTRNQPGGAFFFSNFLGMKKPTWGTSLGRDRLRPDRFRPIPL